MSLITLTIAAAIFTQYWDSELGVSAATFVILLAIMFMNACGVKVSIWLCPEELCSTIDSSSMEISNGCSSGLRFVSLSAFA